MELIETAMFTKQFNKIKRRGGEADVVFRQVCGAIEHWKQRQDTLLPKTHYGESRIKHAVKYDLRGFYRLVTTEHAHVRALLWIGTHDEVDAWLNANKGGTFVVSDSGSCRHVLLVLGK